MVYLEALDVLVQPRPERQQPAMTRWKIAFSKLNSEFRGIQERIVSQLNQCDRLLQEPSKAPGKSKHLHWQHKHSLGGATRFGILAVSRSLGSSTSQLQAEDMIIY